MFQMFTRNYLPIFVAAVLLLFGCSSGKKQAEVEEPIQFDDDVGLEGGGNEKNSANINENINENSQDLDTVDDGENVAEEKSPISEDGYDDDWNNLNSQQQKANNNKNNNKNLLVNDEPPLQNMESEEFHEENQPFQNVVNEPVQQFLIEEPAIDQEPAPVPEYSVEVFEEPGPTPPQPLIGPVVSGAPLIKNDSEPVFAQLFWVGYDYLEKDSLVRIEIVTRGSPRYNLFQERNKSDQPELVLRFFNTRLRHKVRRDIDASQFRSPVAYVRMRADDFENSVDVIITLRDGVRPRMYSKYGNIMLTFPIPDHYFGNAAIGSAPIAKAEVLANANIMPELDTESEIPEGLRIARAFVNNPGKDAFGEVPSDVGVPVVTEALPVSNGLISNSEGLPSDFGMFNQEAQGNFGNINNNQNAYYNDQQANFSDESNFDNYNENNLSNFNQQNQGYDDFDFGGSQPVNAQMQANFSEEELNGNENDMFQENTGDELDEDSLNNFEDNGESEEDINKFDVRNQMKTGSPILLVAGFAVTQMSINAVAQDNFNDDEYEDNQDEENYEFGNAASENNIGNGALDNSNQNFNENFGQNFNQNNYDGNFLDTNNDEGNFFGKNNTNGNNSGFGNFGNNNVSPENPNNNVFPTNSNNGALNPTSNNSYYGSSSFNNNVPMSEGASFNEPVLDGNPDFTGPETEGSDNENLSKGSAGGRKIKLDFRGAPLREVIRVLSDESGVNFVYAPAVENLPIHISLLDIPFNDALKALLSSHSLGMLEIGPNIIKIDSLAALAAENRAIEERRNAELRIRPTKILVHRLSYAKADQVAATISPMLIAAAAGDQRVNIQTDTRSNSVIVNAVPEILAVAKSLFQRLDLETPQVKIASRIVEVIKTNTDRIGISWGTPFNYDQGRGLGFGSLVFPNYMLSRYTVDAGGTTPATGNMQFRLGSINNTMALDLALSLEEAIGTTEIIQSNDITVDDNTQAVITAGRTDYLAPVAGVNQQGPVEATPIDYKLSLTVTPQITGDGSVQMNLSIVSEDPSEPAAPSAAAAKNSKSVQTKLLRRSGETAVIAGVYNSDVKKSQRGVPFFSKIPIIGALFRSSNSADIKRELLIMVTPTILPSIGKSSASGDPVSMSFNSDGNNNFNSQNFNNFNNQYQNQNNSDTQFNNVSDQNNNQNNNFNNQNSNNNQNGNFENQNNIFEN